MLSSQLRIKVGSDMVEHGLLETEEGSPSNSRTSEGKRREMDGRVYVEMAQLNGRLRNSDAVQLQKAQPIDSERIAKIEWRNRRRRSDRGVVRRAWM